MAELELGDRIEFAGRGLRLARILSTSSELFAQGVAKGMSGSPIIDNSGAIVGALASDLDGTVGTRCFGWLAADAMRQAIQEQLSGHERAPAPDTGPTEPELWPGKAIELASIWGDLTRQASGVVSLRQDSYVLVLAHWLAGQGGCVYALRLSTVAGVTTHRYGMTKIHMDGQIVGTVFHDGRRGCIGAVGLAPSACKISIDLVRGASRESYEVFVAGDPDRAPELLREVCQRVGEAQVLLPQSGNLRFTVQADGSEFSAETTHAKLESELVTGCTKAIVRRDGSLASEATIHVELVE